MAISQSDNGSSSTLAYGWKVLTLAHCSNTRSSRLVHECVSYVAVVTGIVKEDPQVSGNIIMAPPPPPQRSTQSVFDQEKATVGERVIFTSELQAVNAVRTVF